MSAVIGLVAEYSAVSWKLHIFVGVTQKRVSIGGVGAPISGTHANPSVTEAYIPVTLEVANRAHGSPAIASSRVSDEAAKIGSKFSPLLSERRIWLEDPNPQKWAV